MSSLINQSMSRKSFVGAAAVAGLGLTAAGRVATALADGAGVEFTPGTYTVETGGHNGKVVVDVTFSESAIEDIKVVEHNESKSVGNWGMDMVAEQILANQTIAVDAVAGATVSSFALIGAVEEAIKQAGVDPADFSAPIPDDSVPPEDTEVDVVIVGAGSAGVMAAWQANELGLSTILVEQLGIIGGSSTRAGGMNVAMTKANGYGPDMAIPWYEYCVAPAGPNLDEGLIDREYCWELAYRGGKINDIFWDMGVEFVPNNIVANANYVHYAEGGTRIMWWQMEVMRDYLENSDVDVRLNTRGKELVTNEDGDVTGIVCVSPQGTEYTISAKGVVLATCGYFASEELTARFAPGFENNTHDVCKGADGSGILMAEAVGGVPTLMDKFSCHGLATSYLGASRSLTFPAKWGCIAVNDEGVRFTNEAVEYANLTAAVREQQLAGHEVFCIMDQALIDSPWISGDIGASGMIEMYTVADTPEELAEALGIKDPAAFAETIARYGEFVHNGVDEDFGKDPENQLSDLQTPPYYGVMSRIENHTVYGGIATDNDARVLREDGSVIRGLYAAGEVALWKECGRSPLGTCMDMGMQAVKDIFTR